MGCGSDGFPAVSDAGFGQTWPIWVMRPARPGVIVLWREYKNVRHNARIRSALYMMTAPLRWSRARS